MPYIGNTPAEKYAAFNVQHFTTSATTSYTLTHAVANELDIRLVLNNVVQQPGASYAYTASATTLTLSVATTGTDTMYAVYIGKAVQTVTPGANSVGPTALQDNSVTNAKLADATQGDIIYYGAAGAPAQLAAGTSGYVLQTQGAGANPVWAADAAGTITAFTNGVDNRVVTATSATALNGETNFIYNGTLVGAGADGAGADLGTGIHIKTSDNGGGSVNASADELVIESNGNAGMTIGSGNSSTGTIAFGDVDKNDMGIIEYHHNTNKMNFRINDADAMVIDSAGTVTKPLNPAFRVYQSTQTTYAPNHTMYNQNITEVYDVNGNYGTSFTAPVTGKYLFTASFYDVTASDAQTYDMMLTTSNRGYRWGNRNAYKSGYTGYGGNMKGEGTIIVDMDASDTAYVACGSSGNVDNGSNSEHSYFSGILIG